MWRKSANAWAVFRKRLSLTLDHPGFAWKELVFTFQICQFVFESWVQLRQLSVLKKPEPPEMLKEELDKRADTFKRSQEYGRAKAKFELVNMFISQIQNYLFLQYEIMPKLWDFAAFLIEKYVPEYLAGETVHSFLFMWNLMLVQQISALPCSLYHTFVLEEAYGFNKQTIGLYFVDMIKHHLLTGVFMPPILAGFLGIVNYTGDSFYFYLWVFVAVVQVFMITIYPIVILPLFNTLSPLPDGELKTKVEDLARQFKFPLSELYVIDGSKRSAHSNAYFFGLPWKKHIVIYDTLIDQSEPDEVVAVLAHELGHWKCGHTLNLFGISMAHFFYIFALFSIFINNGSLYTSFGFRKERPVIVGFFLFIEALTPIEAGFKLFTNVMTRQYEFEADSFAKTNGFGKQLAAALIKLQIQNLSTMDADWIYASYHFSHPHLTERLKAIERTEKTTAKRPLIDDSKGKANATGRDEL